MGTSPSGKAPQGWGAVFLIAPAILFLTVFIILPFVNIFIVAFQEGWEGFARTFEDENTVFSIFFTLGITLAALPVTAAFGVFAAWALAKFRFPGRSLILAAIDLPFSISPIIGGLLFVLLYGKYGFFGPVLEQWGLAIVFSWPGVLLTTLFVVMPFVVKELLPTMEEQGNEEEEASVTLGASGWITFWKVTLPNIRWALLYGLTLAAARAAGEFGASSVVSGLIRGKTATLPIQIEILYNEYQTTAAFSAAFLFVLFALITLLFKTLLEKKVAREKHK